MKAVEFMTLEVFYESGNGGVSFSPNKLLPGRSHTAHKIVQIFCTCCKYKYDTVTVESACIAQNHANRLR